MSTIQVVKCDNCGNVIDVENDEWYSLKCEERGGYHEDSIECNIYLNKKDGTSRCINNTVDGADFCSKECFIKYITVGF